MGVEGGKGRELITAQGRVVQNTVKWTQGWCEIWIQISKFKKQNQFYSLCLQFDDWMA